MYLQFERACNLMTKFCDQRESDNFQYQNIFYRKSKFPYNVDLYYFHYYNFSTTVFIYNIIYNFIHYV